MNQAKSESSHFFLTSQEWASCDPSDEITVDYYAVYCTALYGLLHTEGPVCPLNRQLLPVGRLLKSTCFMSVAFQPAKHRLLEDTNTAEEPSSYVRYTFGNAKFDHDEN